jgi:hypothetical protein
MNLLCRLLMVSSALKTNLYDSRQVENQRLEDIEQPGIVGRVVVHEQRADLQ